MSDAPTKLPRVRKRQVEKPQPLTELKPGEAKNSLPKLTAEIYAAKIAADEAKAKFDALKKDGQTVLAAAKQKAYILDAEGDRPAVEIKINSKTTNTIDPRKFRDETDDDEFFASISVKATEAKKHLGGSRLDKITTSKAGSPYLEVRAKGGSR